MRNVEFKCELRDADAARAQCRALGARLFERITQKDTYFTQADGRLKRREIDGDEVEWILYQRPNRAGAKLSDYSIYSEEEAEARFGKRLLRHPWVEVVKTREVWLFKNIRVHLDEVEGLGPFLEFEAQVTDEHDEASCTAEVAELRAAFGPILGEAIAESYSDLMARKQDEERGEPG